MEDFEKIMSLDPASVVEYCTNPNTPPNMALSKLMNIISTAGKLFEELTDDQMREVLLKLQTIGRGLRHDTCENNAMRIQQAKDIGIPVYTFNEGELIPY